MPLDDYLIRNARTSWKNVEGWLYRGATYEFHAIVWLPVPDPELPEGYWLWNPWLQKIYRAYRELKDRAVPRMCHRRVMHEYKIQATMTYPSGIATVIELPFTFSVCPYCWNGDTEIPFHYSMGD